MTPMQEFLGYVALFSAMVTIFFLLADLGQHGPGKYPVRETVVEYPGLEIDIVTDTDERTAMVRLTFRQGADRNCAFISGRQAHELAEWLRIAASPGRTVAQARFKRKHGGHSSVEVTEQAGIRAE